MSAPTDDSIDTVRLKTIEVGDSIAVHDLAERLGEKVGTVITELMKNGVMATINDNLDRDTAAIIAGELGAKISEPVREEAPKPARSERNLSKSAVSRPPVVAVMGHVDHGKTTLLDAIRGTDKAGGEAGGITQHISAYHIKHKGRALTFLDTPGHEAFASLRQHGAALTDVAVIVVAADDGVKPQTKEAVDFARKAGVALVVAINKIDQPGADSKRVKQQLAELGLTPEDWGGETVVVEVSAKKKKGIDQLLDMVLLVADITELKAETDVPPEGIVIESHQAVGKGSVATLLIEHGELHPQDYVVAGSTYAKVRAIEDENGKLLKLAGPSRAVKVSGFKAVPNFGDRFHGVESERAARSESEQNSDRQDLAKARTVKSIKTADEVLSKLETTSQRKVYNLIIKADVRGSLESLTKSLGEIGNEEVSVRVVASGIGDINESDVAVAKSSGATVMGFHVGISSLIKRIAARDGVPVKLYEVIYELLDDVRAELEARLSPEIIEKTVGKLRVKAVFRTTRNVIICGGEVVDGKVMPGTVARLSRGEEILGEASVAKVQRGQQETKEVVKGELCGVELQADKKILLNEGDEIAFLTREERARKLS